MAQVACKRTSGIPTCLAVAFRRSSARHRESSKSQLIIQIKCSTTHTELASEFSGWVGGEKKAAREVKQAVALIGRLANLPPYGTRSRALHSKRVGALCIALDVTSYLLRHVGTGLPEIFTLKF